MRSAPVPLRGTNPKKKKKKKKLLGNREPCTTTSTPCRRQEPVPKPPYQYLDFERELRRAEPTFETQKGKDTVKDFFVVNPIPRPYMFLKGPGFRTPKDKIAHRDKMTYQEYVLAFTSLLKDKRACTQAEWPDLITHLHQVASDAQTRPWQNVRDWSDQVFTRIENGDITWASRAEIQFDRMRLSLAPSSLDQQSKQAGDHTGLKQVVCSDYNARRCKHRDNHMEGTFTFLHVCAWCHAALNNKNPHTVVRCENKIRFTQDRQPQQHTQPAPFSNRQQTQQQYQGPPTQTQYQPRRQVFTSAVIQNPQPQQKPKNDG